jgi:outer membrane protein, heavy metal efflux system
MSPRILSLIAVLPLAGCISPNPNAAFDDVDKEVAARTGQSLHWIRNDRDQDEIERRVQSLLQTNLTAESAVAIALLNNRSLQAEFEAIGISQAELAQASRLENPEFSGSWRWPNESPKVLNAEYAIAQNFLDVLLLPARRKIASRNVQSTKLRTAHEVLDLWEKVQVAFHTLQGHQQIAERLRLIVEVNEAGVDLSRRQYQAGNINNLELHNQEAAYAESKLDLANVEVEIRSDREKLNRLLGLWGKQTSWQIVDTLPPLPKQELPLEAIESVAIRLRLDLAAARGELQAISGALKLKGAFRYFPAVNVGVNAERELDRSWLVGPTLDVEIPIFDQGQSELAILTSEYRRAQRNFEALAVDIRSEVRELRDALIAAREKAAYHQNVLLPQRQRILRETLLQYNAMQISNYELLGAKERQQRAEEQSVEALRDYWIARAELQRAAGGRLDVRLPQEMPVEAGSKAEPQHHHHNH